MSRKKGFFTYTGLFLIIFVLGFLVFFVQGKSFVWKGDGYRQYYPALSYLGRYYRSILSGIWNGSFHLPMIDYTIGQGEDIITTLSNYGLGDPLTLFSVFVPSKYTEYLYDVLVVVRLYLSGAMFLVYCEGMRWKRNDSVLGALVYAFCGFAIWSIKDPFFLNALIYLPLVLFGIERIMKGKSPMSLILSVFICVVSGYYFFYMIVFAALAYFFVRSYAKYGKNIRSIWRSGVRCLAAAVGGVMLSGVLTVPLLYGFMESSRTEAFTPLSSLFVYPVKYYKNMFTKFIAVTGNEDAGAVGYFSMAVILFVALYVIVRKKDRTSVIMRNSVILTFAAVASPFVGYAMNGFGYVTNRFMFVPAFVLASVLVRVLPDLFELGSRDRRRLIAGAAVYALLCLVLSVRDGIVPALFMTVMLGFLLAALFGIQNAVWRRRAVCGLLVLNLAGNINVVYQNFGAGIANVYLDAGSVWDSYTGDKPLNRAKKLLGTSGSEELKRIDVMLHRGENPNQSVVSGYPGISVYYSVINGGYSQYMTSLGNAPDLLFTHRVLGNDGRTILENLANVAYVVTRRNERVPYGFEPVKKKKNVYANKNKTSVGYFYDSYVSGSDYDKADVFQRQNTLLESAVLESDSSLFARAEASAALKKGEVSGEAVSLPFELAHPKHFTWQNGVMEVTEKKGTFRAGFKMKPGKEYYLRFTGLELDKAESDFTWAHVSVGEMTKKFCISNPNYDFYFGRNDYIVNLGSLPEEEKKAVEQELTCRISGPAQYRLENIELVEVPVDHVADRVEKLCEYGVQDVTVDEYGSVTGSIPRLSEEKLLCLAIPYKKGFTLYVDGQETQIEKINKMYIGAWIEPGEHEISLEYATPGTGKGLLLSIFGILVSIGVMIRYKRSWKA